MGTLIEQINELIGVLEIVDPEAAAALRGGRAPGQVNLAGSRQTAANDLAYTSGMAPANAEIFPTVKEITTTVMEIAPTVKDIAPTVMDIAPTVTALPVTSTEITDAGSHPGISPHDSILNPLYVNLKSDSLIKGIIYSEILGMPVSRRRRYKGQ